MKTCIKFEMKYFTHTGSICGTYSPFLGWLECWSWSVWKRVSYDIPKALGSGLDKDQPYVPSKFPCKQCPVNYNSNEHIYETGVCWEISVTESIMNFIYRIEFKHDFQEMVDILKNSIMKVNVTFGRQAKQFHSPHHWPVQQHMVTQ